MCRARRRRLLSQFEDLQQCYLRLRNPKKRPAQPLKLPQLSANKQQALDQPAKRIKQEPDMGVQPPSDSAGSHPLGGAHPGEPDSINQAQDKQQDGCYTAAPQNGIGGAHSDGAGMPAHSHPAGRASSNGHADPEKGWSHKGFPDKGPSENGYRQNSVAESGKGGMAGNSQHLSDQQHATAKVVGPADEEGLAEFSRMLSVFTHCARLKVIAQLPRTSNAHCSNILSSIEFDRDGQVRPAVYALFPLKSITLCMPSAFGRHVTAQDCCCATACCSYLLMC